MNRVIIPHNYKEKLDIYQTQLAISRVKQVFQQKLAAALCLKRVTAPLFVLPETGLNDDLNGIERAVTFDIKATGKMAQVVHSLAKWKRMALHQYHFEVGTGLYTDMNAIRRDEDMDNLHSIYVDQWDWEMVILPEDRNLAFLKETVKKVVAAICNTSEEIRAVYPSISVSFSPKVSFITTQELEDLYPSLSPKEREKQYVKEHKTVFLMQIGDQLRSGGKHDGRAPDYDDWSLNGDILFWNDILGCAFEISSMGIRVDEETMQKQLELAGCPERAQLRFHKELLEGKLPLTAGGGIGQSRLCMLLLGKAHIGEVQASIWPHEMRERCEQAGIWLL